MKIISRTTKTTSVLFTTADIKAAWDWLWADNRRDEAGSGFRNQNFYLTATDLERRLKAAAAEKVDGVPIGEYGRDHMCYRSAIRLVVGESPLVYGRKLDTLGVVRRWLQTERSRGRLEEFNFGRGHISGARYRPAGSGYSAAEEKAASETREERSRRKNPRHWAREDGKATCGAGDKKRNPFSSFRSRGFRSRPTCEAADVTCLKCLKLVVKAAGDLGREAGMPDAQVADLPVVADKLFDLGDTDGERRARLLAGQVDPKAVATV